MSPDIECMEAVVIALLIILNEVLSPSLSSLEYIEAVGIVALFITLNQVYVF